MKEITVTQGKVALVSDEDYEYLSQFKWQILKGKTTCYATRSTFRKDGKRTTLFMHRIILGIIHNPEIECDHIDRNGLNNQRINLRTATKSQNNANRRSVKNSSSSFLGVGWAKKSKKWQVFIRDNHTQIYLGTYENEIDAALVYNKAAIKIHGEFANLNKITA